MNENKKAASLYIDARKDYFSKISEKIWEYAELSLKEFKSSELYINALKEEGFEVETDIAGIKTAFSGKFGSGKPVIAILGEFDALSGLSQKAGETCKTEFEKGGNGHGCGHNLLGAGALASAFAVKNYLEKTKRPGTVAFPSGAPGHSWQNVSCANSKIGIKGMIFAAKILALSAVDLFEDGSILEKAKNEFTENSKEGFVSPIPDGAILPPINYEVRDKKTHLKAWAEIRKDFTSPERKTSRNT